MLDAAERSGELRRGRTILEPSSGNTGIALAALGRVRGYPVRIVLPESATSERVALLQAFGAEIISSPGELGSNGAVALARELAAEADRSLYMPFQYANPANPDVHYRTTAVEILEECPDVDAFVAGLGTGGTLMGVGRRLREANPDVQIVAAEPLAGDDVSGLRSLEDGYVPEVLDVSQLDRKLLVSNAEAVRGLRLPGARGGHLRRRLRRRRAARRAEGRRRARGPGEHRHAVRRRRLEVPLGRALGSRRGRSSPARWSRGSGGRPARRVVRRCRERCATRSSRTRARASRTRPAASSAAATGLRRRSIPTRNADESPYRYTVHPDDLAAGRAPARGRRRRCRRHLPLAHTSAPYPSRTDVELATWPDAAYLIVSLRSDPAELAAFRLADGRIEELALEIA